VTFTLHHMDLSKDLLSVRRMTHANTVKNDRPLTGGADTISWERHDPKTVQWGQMKSSDDSPSADDIICDNKKLLIQVRDCPGPGAYPIVSDEAFYPIFFKAKSTVELLLYSGKSADGKATDPSLLAEVTYETSSAKKTKKATRKPDIVYRSAQIIDGPTMYKAGMNKWMERTHRDGPSVNTDTKHYFQCLYNTGPARRNGDISDIGEILSPPAPNCAAPQSNSSSSNSSSYFSSSSTRSGSGSSSSSRERLDPLFGSSSSDKDKDRDLFDRDRRERERDRDHDRDRRDHLSPFVRY